jgi:CheY-like chemotaxis protein
MSFRILVVGPTEPAAGLSLLLQLRGHESRWVLDGIATPDDVDGVDVVLVDTGLSGHAGCEFAVGLTSREPKRPIVIVISNESETPCPEPGIDAHLVKPVDPDQLLSLVERLRHFYANLTANDHVAC